MAKYRLISVTDAAEFQKQIDTWSAMGYTVRGELHYTANTSTSYAKFTVLMEHVDANISSL